MIVDDDGFNIYALELLIDNLGYKYESVNNGKIAIDKILSKYKDQIC